MVKLYRLWWKLVKESTLENLTCEEYQIVFIMKTYKKGLYNTIKKKKKRMRKRELKKKKCTKKNQDKNETEKKSASELQFQHM